MAKKNQKRSKQSKAKEVEDLSLGSKARTVKGGGSPSLMLACATGKHIDSSGGPNLRAN
jgi:hypothetical protein